MTIKYYCYDEPIFLDEFGNEFVSSKVIISSEEIIKLQRNKFKKLKYADDSAILDDFIVTNFAYEVSADFLELTDGDESLDKWDIRFFRLAKSVQSWSKDPSTKVGAVIVKDKKIIATGYNGIPSLIKDDSRILNRDWKLLTTIHAEHNALLNAAKNGSRVANSTIYVTMFPCSNCSSAIIQSGISRVVCPNEEWPERWISNFEQSRLLLYEANISLTVI